MDFINKTFDLERIKSDQSITVTFRNGKQRNGFVKNVTPKEITYTYFDELVNEKQTSVISIEQVDKGVVMFTSSNNNEGFSKKENNKNDALKNNNKSKKNFFDMLNSIREVEQLVKVFKSEDAQTLALIAHYLNPQSRSQFLYFLPDNVLTHVIQHMKSVSNIKDDILNTLEKQLGDKYNKFKDQEEEMKKETNQKNKSNENKQEKSYKSFFDNYGGEVFGSLGGLVGGLGINPEDLLKGLNPEDLKKMMGSEGNNSSLPNPDQIQVFLESMAEDMPKMINDIFDIFNIPNEDDEDENNNF